MDSLKTKGQMYDQIDLGKIQKSGFDLSYNSKGTGRIGRIIPTRCQEVLPGDRMKGSSSAAVQFEPLAVPMLANMFVRQEHFYVPNRIVWRNWDKFFTGGEKLDYNTPPPSFSLSSIFGYLKSRLPSVWNGVALPLNVKNLVMTDHDVTAIDFEATDIVSIVGSIGKNIANLVSSKGVLDLLQPFIDVWDSFSRKVDSNFEDYKILYHFNPGTDFSTDRQIYALRHIKGDDGENFKTVFCCWLNAQSTDPYERAILRVLDTYLYDLYISSGYYQKYPVDSTNNIYFSQYEAYPTDSLRELVHTMYNAYRQYVGTSSNLDYLNYPRLTLSDFYFMVYSGYQLVIHDFDSGSAPQSIEPLLNSGILSSRKLSALALRANYAIWYNFYRDQLLEVDCPEPSIVDSVTPNELFHLLLPRQRCWAKDTFTTALTSTGTGNVVVPVNNKTSGITAGIKYLTRNIVNGADSASVGFINADVATIETSNGDKIDIPTRFISGLSKESKSSLINTEQSYFSLDMLDACRRAQKWLQKALIYGNRPQDRLYTSWGVRSLDARLQLPECLSTSSQIVQLSVNTNNTTIQDPTTGAAMSVAGDKSANAYGYDQGGSFDRFCEEHGLIISFLTILPEATYPYAVHRGHMRMDKFDYPTPEFATLGMDAVYMQELCPQNFELKGYNSDEVFGYQGRYGDHKCNQDEEHGELQTSQNMYTFGRQWSPYNLSTRPKLNYQFVHCFPKLDMFVVEDSNEDYFRYDVHHAMAAERALPVCGTYL